jgi:hypothetical protein
MMKKYNFEKRLRKYRIARVLLHKYLKTWESKNCFYFSIKDEIHTLEFIIGCIKQGISPETLSNGEYQFLKDIGNAKQLKYGKYQYTF